ncbi:hypothetical protein LTR16_001519 [Cryomyces antarcticus]|uniref:Potassium channel domain-containing protein n=1 Tax=Cryomyces antarcticus TaxID=329879 RepID=A0ABR0LZI3_9PEZI|nr:hypothetical protein LTR39_000963 [Cryomyces antarcticus]KAK5257138.1 hypothetical protein LTR16_001519 [Cryomyces antarcticus]
MARRLRFSIAQPITIIGFLLASFILVVLVAVASTPAFQTSDASHALTQAFYYANFAAGLYFIIALLMLATVWGAYRGHYEKEFRLTVSQRTLMLQTIGFMIYLLLGAMVFSKLEGWDFLDGVYWANFTLLTIGVGVDFTPKYHASRSLLFFYAIGGVVTVGLVIGSIRTLVLERGKQKFQARITEKKRESALSSIDFEKQKIRVGLFKKVSFSEDGKGMTEHERREQEFHVMRKIQDRAETRRRWMALAISATAAAALWLVGAAIFMVAERNQQWSYFVSLYFAYTSLLTIGYGDLQPMSNSGKPFFVFWTLLAVPTLTILISNMGDTVVKGFSDATIWLGELTVLPGETGVRSKIKSAFHNMTGGHLSRLLKTDEISTQQPNALNANESIRPRRNKNTSREDAGERGDPLERDIHFYHYLLARELRNLTRDVLASPPKKYTYQEWSYYLKLIGQDEGSTEGHRKPPIKVEKEAGKRKNKGADIGAGDEKEAHAESKPWSWLGNRSPLMGSKQEAEWILERLSLTLERELRKMRSPDLGEQREVPPISMKDLRRRVQKS